MKNQIVTSSLSTVLLVVVLFLSPLNLLAERHPYRAKVTGLLDLAELEVGEETDLRVSGFGGSYDLAVTRVETPSPRVTVNRLQSVNGLDPAKLRLFRGRVERKSNRLNGLRRIAVDQYRGRFRIRFVGHRGRNFIATIFRNQIGDDGSAVARLTHTPSTKSLPCGTKDFSFSQAPTQSGDAAKEFASSEPIFDPLKVLDLGTDADKEFFDENGSSVSDTNAEITSIINAVDAIYLAQIGIDINVVSQNVFTTTGQPYASTEAEDLLNEFRSYTNTNAHIDGDLKHLFTGKTTTVDGDPGVIGVAFTGVVCLAPTFSYGLSESVNSSIQTLVTAHEIGHNFSASHDCSGIMAPVADPANTSFSQCSINEINSHVNSNGSCLAEGDSSSNISDLIKLRTKITRKNKFKTTITFTENLFSGCIVTLYGAAKTSQLDGVFASATEIFSGQVDPDQTKIVTSSRKLRRTPTKKAHFQLNVQCDGEDDRQSPRRSIRARSGNNLNTTKPKKFINHVRKKYL